MLLATDLDGTFLAGDADARAQLYALIDARPDIQLAYVTGRNFALVAPLLDDPQVAKPDYIICDVGTTVVDCAGLAVEPLQSQICDHWPGEERVVAAMAGVPGLVRQDQPQTRRCSYYCEPEAVTTAVHEIVAALGCDLLFSADRYLDVLPRGVNKGSTLMRFVAHAGIDPAQVLVAGDTLNDLSMYEQGFKGVCVGASEPALLAATRERSHVLHATRPGCGGILDALHHFALI